MLENDDCCIAGQQGGGGSHETRGQRAEMRRDKVSSMARSTTWHTIKGKSFVCRQTIGKHLNKLPLHSLWSGLPSG